MYYNKNSYNSYNGYSKRGNSRGMNNKYRSRGGLNQYYDEYNSHNRGGYGYNGYQEEDNVDEFVCSFSNKCSLVNNNTFYQCSAEQKMSWRK